MIKIAIILFRECLEISFLLGIIIAVTRKMPNARMFIIAGIMTGVFGSSLFAFSTKFLTASYFGLGDEIFDVSVMLVTVAMIIWTIAWVQHYAKNVQYKFSNLENQQGNDFATHMMLTTLIATTVLREGAEIILLIYSISIADKIHVNDYLIGGGIGAVLGLLFGFAIYAGLIRFANRHIFKVSSILLTLIAAGIAAKAAGVMTSVGFIESFSNELWDSSWLITDTSRSGKLLNSLIGYSARPNQLQGMFYLTVMIITIFFIKIQNDTTKRA
jgi:high-affinity iron transporter